jgi:hypothetical protein
MCRISPGSAVLALALLGFVSPASGDHSSTELLPIEADGGNANVPTAFSRRDQTDGEGNHDFHHDV